MVTMVLDRSGASAERRFYSGMAIAILAVVFVGFAPSFYLRPLFPERVVPPEPVFLLHGLSATAWILLVLVQARLIAARRIALHRALGAAGVLIAALVVALGVAGARVAAVRDGGFLDVPVPPLQFLAVPLFDMALFGGFVTMAVLRRRELQAHKRWMLLATIALLPAAVARMPGVGAYGPLAFFALADLFVLAIAAWDAYSRGRLHAVTLRGGLLMIASQPVRLVLSGTAPWLAFAGWVTGTS